MFISEKRQKMRRRAAYVSITLALIFGAAFQSAIFAQKSKTSKKKANETKVKETKKDSTKNTQNSRNSKEKSPAKEKEVTASKKNKDLKSKNSANDKARSKREQAEKLLQARREREEERRRQAENARQEAERRAELARREAERRAEIARREAARREAIRQEILRRRAFEEGLRSETANNINNDDVSGEDLAIRQAAVAALGRTAGTVVVLDAQTGRVYSMVNQNWAVRKAFKPCSVIKLVTGAAGLGEGAINSAGSIGGGRFNLTDALAFSDNRYFQKVGANVGIGKILSYARNFRLGEPTGINVEGETSGQIPSGNNGGTARNYSHGDGFELTPLQLARVVSTIANGGNLITPRVPKTAQEKTSFQGVARSRVEISASALQGLLPGMIGAVNYGTARRAQDSGLNIGGKTGSCIGQGSWLGLFASVAPVVNPRYAVVVVTRGSNARGKYAAAIAGQVYKALERQILRDTGAPVYVANLPQNLKPQTQVTKKQAAAIAESEDEEMDEIKSLTDDGELLDEREINRQITKKRVAEAMPRKNGKFGKDSETSRENASLTVPKTPTVAPRVVPTTIVIPRGKPKAVPSRPRRVVGSFLNR